MNDHPILICYDGTANAGRAVQTAAELFPACTAIVLDVEMPSLRGVDIVEALRRDGLGTRVVLLSAHLDSDTVYEAVAGGVSAYISKSAPGERICDAIAAVARGEVILPAEVQAGLAAEIRLRSEPGRPALSPREQEVLRLIAEGMSAPSRRGDASRPARVALTARSGIPRSRSRCARRRTARASGPSLRARRSAARAPGRPG